MLTSVQATNLETATTLTINDGTYPLRVFEWDYQIKGEAEPKMQKPGRHDALKQVDFMTIELEGDILADISQNYWNIRKAFMEVFLPHPESEELNHVRLLMQVAGSSDILYADCTLQDVDAPLEALYPTRTPFRFSYESNFGYWRNVATDAVVFI